MFNERMTDYIEGNFKSCLKGGEGFVPVYYPHIQKKMKEKVLKKVLELLAMVRSFFRALK